MRLICLLTYFLLACNLHAKEIAINYRLKNFRINYDLEKISYKANGVDLSLQKKDCNIHLIKKAYTQLEKIIAQDFLDKSSENTYTITIDKVKKYDLFTSASGHFFENFHDYFKTLKIEELLSCK